MTDKTKTAELLSALSTDMSSEEMMLSGLQALLAARITMRRRELGMSQKELADAMCVTQSLVSKWESGETNFTLKTLVQIASVLGLEMTVPFVMEHPIVYSKTPDKVIDIFDKRPWRSSSTFVLPSYTLRTDELKEN